LIPAHDNIHPVVFDLSSFDEKKLKNVSIVAGHFSWDVWTHLPSMRSKTPSCLVMGRDPVDRVVSYYYQRCYHDPTCPQHKVPFNNLTTLQLTSFIRNYRQALPNADGELVIVDEGTSDASCRALSNRKVTTGQSIRHNAIPPSLETWEEELALKNLETCVVGVQEEWTNTKKMINHWFPWIVATKKQEKWQTEVEINRESIEMIDPSLRQIVEELNQCDIKLYQKMKSQFKKQLSVMETDAYL
jgi:hypothetical protein